MTTTATDISPFNISIPDQAIVDLNTRLSLTRFPDELHAAAWDYGAPLADIKRLAAYWKDSYSWRSTEQKLNDSLPQFTTSIAVEGFSPLKIHFLHKTSANENAIPLLFVHGWPGSFLEATKIMNDLTSPGENQPAFHVVAPSIPNYGFSEGVTKKGFALAQFAETCHKLMLKLGYSKYVTQGGDWGYYITRAMAIRYPQSCKATHVNFPQGEAPTFQKSPFLTALQHAVTPYTPAEKAGFARTNWFVNEGSGYGRIQSTRPQTVGYSLTDSPVGLLSWIYEKLHDWTDAYPWTDDEICTWVSVYWFSTAGPAASLRVYYEVNHENDDPATRVSRAQALGYIGAGVKLGLTHAPKELRVFPSSWTKGQGEVVFERRHENGGHFFAWECPKLLVEDIREMFGRGGGAEGVVKGRSGY